MSTSLPPSSRGPVLSAQIAAFAAQTDLFFNTTDLTPEQSLFVLPGLNSHLAWQAAHLAMAVSAQASHYTVEAVPDFPAHLRANVFPGSQPVQDAAAYPTYAESKAIVQGSLRALAAGLATMSDEELDKPLPQASPLAKIVPNLAALVGLIQVHTAYHYGQMAYLRRALGLPCGVGV